MIHTIVQHHTPIYQNLKRANVYYVLTKLAKSGHLRAHEEPSTRSAGKQKLVYSLTAKGEKLFSALLEEVITQARPVLPDIEIAAVLLGEIPLAESQKLLERRLASVVDYQARTIKRFGKFRARGLPATLAATHTLKMIETEIRWLTESLRLYRGTKKPG
ncbi:MAG: helix-turn-helix transcriptional regulator [Candidatus Eremiobacteraeota bacterium]|nr:helix-turn-helix transcriptional regulator [Candidatus Eremiobacteraeota bacterium]